MRKMNRKILIIVSALIAIGIIGFVVSNNVVNEKKIVESSFESNDNSKKVDDVVNAITEIDYQSITALKEENGSKAYVVVNLDNDNVESNIDSILDLADKSKIRLTFIGNEKISDKKNPYFKLIEENGHTIIPDYINVKNILKENNVKIIDEKSDLKDAKNQDIAFFVDLSSSQNVLNEEDKDDLFESIDNLKNDFYTFKALI
ncbi:hypothetical protein QJR52_11600 [Clostridium baratii]|uniref:hypothetical protein n=1 Tax=Clostridium baratii TaxID=1561 RepID=UPI0030D563CA